MESGGIGADGGHLGITVAFGVMMDVMGYRRGVMVGGGRRRVGGRIGRMVGTRRGVIGSGAIRRGWCGMVWHGCQRFSQGYSGRTNT